MSQDLKSCPFCGAPGIVHGHVEVPGIVRRLDEMAEFYRYRPHSDADVPGLEEITKRERDELFALLDEAARRLSALSHPAPAAEPVAWRRRAMKNFPWTFTSHHLAAEDARLGGYEVEPLYASPPPEPVAISRGELSAILDEKVFVRSLSPAELDPGYTEGYGVFGLDQAADAILSKLSGYPLVEGEKG